MYGVSGISRECLDSKHPHDGANIFEQIRGGRAPDLEPGRTMRLGCDIRRCPTEIIHFGWINVFLIEF